jgi:hypothetical protein
LGGRISANAVDESATAASPTSLAIAGHPSIEIAIAEKLNDPVDWAD